MQLPNYIALFVLAGSVAMGVDNDPLNEAEYHLTHSKSGNHITLEYINNEDEQNKVAKKFKPLRVKIKKQDSPKKNRFLSFFGLGCCCERDKNMGNNKSKGCFLDVSYQGASFNLSLGTQRKKIPDTENKTNIIKADQINNYGNGPLIKK